jgi:hypothetical protein
LISKAVEIASRGSFKVFVKADRVNRRARPPSSGSVVVGVAAAAAAAKDGNSDRRFIVPASN